MGRRRRARARRWPPPPQSPNLDDARQVGSPHHEVPHYTCPTRRRRDLPMADRQLVLAFFPDEPAADNAAAALKDSGIAHGDAIGILALDSNGKLKQDKVGARSTGKGAAIGGVLFLSSGTALLGVGGPRRRGGWSASTTRTWASVRCRQGAPHRRAERGQGSGRRDGPQRHCARDLRPIDPARRHVRVPRTHRRSPADCECGYLGSLIDQGGVGPAT